jgi:drug/metabolite transporter (DMT)-like permease
LIENKVAEHEFHPATRRHRHAELGILILVIGVFVANLPARDGAMAERPAGLHQDPMAHGAYTLYGALGIAFLLLLAPRQGASEGKALLLTGVMVGWIFYGALTLMRVVPRYREPPSWLMRFGIADVLLLGLRFACLAAYLWA